MGQRTLAFTRLLLRKVYSNTLRNLGLLVVSGRSSRSLGAISGQLDGQEHESGSLAAADGEGRARERAKVCEMRRGVCAGRRWGYKKGAGRVGGVVAEKPGDVRECACADPRRRAERAELTGLAHGAEREKRDARGNGSTTSDLGPRDRERERERESG
jgi:hypothetical protein